MSLPQHKQQNEENMATSKSKKKRDAVKRLNKSDSQHNQQTKQEDTPPAVEGAGDGGTLKKKQQQQLENCQTKQSKQPLQTKSDALNQNTNNIVVESNILNIYVDHLQRQMQTLLLCSQVKKQPKIDAVNKSNDSSICSTRRNSLQEQEDKQKRRKSDTTTPSPEQLNGENNRPLSKSARLRRKRKEAQRNKYVAIDCEMVGVGHNGQDDMLARVSVVNRQGEVLLDKFVKPWHEVVDYRTSISGIRPKDIENGEEFNVVQDQVIEILQGKILVGHAIRNDLAVLHIKHPYKNIRDTARYKPLCRLVSNGRTPSLKLLSQAILGMEIQIGEHNSVEDARAAMKIYNRLSSDWEKYLQKQQRHNK